MALGALKTLTFNTVNPRGWDVYKAVYENGQADWQIQPLTGGKVEGILITNPVLNNGTLHADRAAYLMQHFQAIARNGAPDYDKMAPPLAAAARAQAPQSLPIIKALGTLQSVTFEHALANGADVYLVTFEHGKIECTIG